MRVLVIDIGGTFIKHGMIDQEGRLTEGRKLPTPKDSLEELYAAVDQILSGYEEIDGISLSVPAAVNSESGVICSGGTLAYLKDVPMVKELEARFHLPAAVENDANCAALAELWQGNLKGVSEGIVVVCGTGIGGAVIHQGQIIRGSHCFAGEFCFLLTDFDTGLERMQQRIASYHCRVPALIREAALATGEEEGMLSGERIFREAEAGNPGFLSAVRKYTRRMAVLLANLQVMFDPERIALGGGISANSLFIDLLREDVSALIQAHPGDVPLPEITPCRFYNSSNLIGAGYNWRLRHYKTTDYESI